ncbi:MAG TPA: hypothetical protein VNZ52_08550, partial [Candidatus Thermoplasmatota archaeon]|nr:hypothetical protein [Candidatus Thermoplasmatota archaeon]
LLGYPPGVTNMKVAAPLLVLLLTLSVALAGCMDGEEAPEDPATAANATRTDTDPVDPADPMDEAPATGDADDPGSRAHKHDYWGERTEVVLVDGEYTPWDGCIYNYDAPVPRFRNGCFWVEMGNGSVVYQGTAVLTVTATWSDPKTTGVAFDYKDAEKDNSGTLIELTSGVAHEIPVTPSTADIPHSKQSRWAFRFMAGGSAPIMNMQGPIHVVIAIKRGLDLPLDPPHPNFWGGKTELDLGTITGTLKPVQKEFLLFGPVWDYIRLPEGTIIPPGTGQVTVHFTYTVKDPVQNVEYRVWPLYASAQHPYMMGVEDEDVQLEAGSGSFTLQVEPEMTDSPYATTSQWRFSLWQGQSAPGTGFPLPSSWFGGGSPFDRDIDYTWHIVLTKAGAEAAPMSMGGDE